MIRNLCVAAIRLLALYLVAITIPNLFFSLMRLFDRSYPFSDNSYEIQNFIGLGITITLAIALWVFSGAIANRIASAPETSQTIAVDAQDFVLIGLCLLGAATLIDSLPNILNTLIDLVIATAPLTDNHHSAIDLSIVWSDQFSPGLQENLIRAVFGFGLLFFGFRLRSLLRKFQTLRTAGHDKPEPISASERSERS
ncbi:hypothetical protein ABWI01_03910 [Oceanicaulis alexandrii]|uniref:hypothetical protein n=1 Tax=Oceanicaulis alexandrii TaxID=153233 RepID=UPI0035D1195F